MVDCSIKYWIPLIKIFSRFYIFSAVHSFTVFFFDFICFCSKFCLLAFCFILNCWVLWKIVEIYLCLRCWGVETQFICWLSAEGCIGMLLDSGLHLFQVVIWGILSRYVTKLVSKPQIWGMVSTRMEGRVNELGHGYRGLVEQMISMGSLLDELTVKMEKSETQFQTGSCMKPNNTQLRRWKENPLSWFSCTTKLGRLQANHIILSTHCNQLCSQGIQWCD